MMLTEDLGREMSGASGAAVRPSSPDPGAAPDPRDAVARSDANAPGEEGRFADAADEPISRPKLPEPQS